MQQGKLVEALRHHSQLASTWVPLTSSSVDSRAARMVAETRQLLGYYLRLYMVIRSRSRIDHGVPHDEPANQDHRHMLLCISSIIAWVFEPAMIT